MCENIGIKRDRQTERDRERKRDRDRERYRERTRSFFKEKQTKIESCLKKKDT
jgi:hypothetical protein